MHSTRTYEYCDLRDKDERERERESTQRKAANVAMDDAMSPSDECSALLSICRHLLRSSSTTMALITY